MVEKSSISYLYKRWRKHRVDYLLKSLLIGILSGISISFFRISIGKILSLSIKIYEVINKY
ncbi:MAG: hypothetical protein CBR30_06800 [Dictyoglomus sp. NZ13-RE01]|nr:MAG: hypothetical protein CBR30_06800 [Dictyoglomus sp. NZ13-RE01]